MSGRRQSPRGLGTYALTAAATAIGGSWIFLKSQSDDLPRDLKFTLLLLRNKLHLQKVAARTSWSAADFWLEAVARAPNKVAFTYICDDDTSVSYTFKEVDELTNQVANWAVSAGIKNRDVVALMMDNRPEFLFTWLGLCKVNATIALINTNLKGKPLIHSLSISSATHFIIGIEHVPEIAEMRNHIRNDDSVSSRLKEGTYYSYSGVGEGFVHLDPLLMKQSIQLLNPLPADRKPGDNLFYIYTSGTTGLPKASMIRHLRFYMVGLGFAEAMKMKSDDIIYNTLPLYHSAGGMIGVGIVFYLGASMVFRRKFSASKFWEDCAKYHCTSIQYIGELCRYLVNHPPKPSDKQHQLRIGIGNGLRPDIWKTFQERFNIPQIGEFYASTEGNASLLNTINSVNAVGFIPRLINFIYPVKIVKFDIENEEVVRDSKTGFCIQCKPGEVGQLIGLIDPADALREFTGYTDAKATQKKILKDVFVKGDMYFATGDLLKSDTIGNFYFVDRIGDTFRWKGENVSTSEVEQVLLTVPGVTEANVYGVKLPDNSDGRCGMACVVVDHKFDPEVCYKITMNELAAYAAPLFLRLRSEMEITTTFKHKKNTLVEEGINHSLVKDPMLYRDDKKKTFVPFTPELYREMFGNTKAKL